MAKIGIYSDVHISHNSSIMPTFLGEYDDKYTTRLKMCIDSMKWAYKQFKDNNVDIIINCGDTFNSHTVSSDELSAMTDIIGEVNIPLTFPNYTLIGNHDKFNNMFNSLYWMQLLEDTTLVNDYVHLSYDDTDIYCISFYDAPEFIDKIQEMLNTYPRECSKAILFMHGDINGSWLSGTKRIENHIPTDFLTQYFDMVINGHIHCHEKIYNQNDKEIFNIGSLTSHSFADSNNHIPACWILDTNTRKLTCIENPHAIVFRTENVEDELDINNLVHSLPVVNNVILKVKCPYDLKDNVEKSLEPLTNVIKTKYIFTYNNEIKSDSTDENKSTNQTSQLDVKDEFITFLSGRNDLKGDIDSYINVLD